MKYAKILVVALALLVAGQVSAQARFHRLRQRLHSMESNASRIHLLRGKIEQFYQAAAQGDRAAAMSLATSIQKSWGELPQRFQRAVESRHPGTTKRIAHLEQEIGSAAATPSQEGNRPRRELDVTHEGTTTGPGGKSATDSQTWNRQGNTVTEQGTYTGPDGRQATQHATTTKNGNTVTRQGTTTGAYGNSVTNTGTWAKNGNSVNHEGTTAGPNGGTTTRTGKWTRSGSTLSYHGSMSGKKANRQFTPHYADSYDLFGGRPIRSGRSSASRTPHHTRTPHHRGRRP